MDEKNILELLAGRRQREAFEMVVDLYQEKVFHLALGMTRNESTARDMAQEALLRVWKALPGYDRRASLSTRIYTITRNVCLTELKRASRRQAIPLDAPESEGTLESLAAPDQKESTAEMDIDTMLASLPVRYQQVLRVFYLEQKSYEETSEMLGIPVGTVKTFLFRARQTLARKAIRARAMSSPTSCG